MLNLLQRIYRKIPVPSSVYGSQSSDVCSLCGEDVNNLKNHVRMSSDERHGPQGRYPKGWTGENTDTGASISANREISDSRESGGAVLEDGGEQELVDVDHQEDVDDHQEAATLELGDSRSEASDYECAECEDRLEYHQSTCSCGESPMWRAPV